MLSVCIPIYNYDVTDFIRSLHSQCIHNNIDFEIILFEDGSDDDFVKLNIELGKWQNVKHIINKQNIGRSAARNRLVSESSYEKILFIDCDSSPVSKDYIKTYVLEFDYPVVCGGTEYQIGDKRKNHELRYKYGIKREAVGCSMRNISPNSSFTTNNFLISKNIIQTIKFREVLTNYGHEDTLLGIDLKKNNIIIRHIDNPVYHLGLESNAVFISKTETSVRNLIFLKDRLENYNELITEIKLLRVVKQVKYFYLSSIIRLFSLMFIKVIKRKLESSSNPSLFLFDLYKLAYYFEIEKNEIILS